jgi:hypothetical protein
LSKPHGGETLFFGWLTHTTHEHGLNETFFFAWVKQNDVLVISSLMYILYIWSIFGIFIAEIHEFLMCVHLASEREKHGLIFSFLIFY